MTIAILFFIFGQIIASSFVLEILQVTVTQDGNPDTGNGGKNDTNSNTGTGNNTTNPNNKKNGKTTNTTTTNSKAVEKSSAASTKKFSLDYRKD